MAKSPEEAMASMLAQLPEKTGKSIEQWLAVTRKSGLAKHGEIVALLKEKHGVTHGYANLIAHKTLASDAVSQAAAGQDLVATQYAGAKSALRPAYDELVARIRAFGPDVDLSPKKAYVSLRRGKQFAIIQPSTATRLDVGINLKGVPPRGRLEASGSFNSMVSHRVKLAGAKDVDDELLGWLRQAYEQA